MYSPAPALQYQSSEGIRVKDQSGSKACTLVFLVCQGKATTRHLFAFQARFKLLSPSQVQNALP